MDLGGVVPVSIEVSPNNVLEHSGCEIRPRKRARIKEHFTNVRGESVLVPDTEMVKLVAPQEEAFKA